MPVSSVFSCDLTCSSCARSSAFTESSSCFETPPQPGIEEYDSAASTTHPSFFILPPSSLFGHILHAAKSDLAAPVHREIPEAVRDFGALGRVLDEQHAAADHFSLLPVIRMLGLAPRIALKPVRRPLDYARAHPVDAEVALPGLLLVLRTPRIEPAAAG